MAYLFVFIVVGRPGCILALPQSVKMQLWRLYNNKHIQGVVQCLVRPGCILTLLKVSECNLVAHATINTNKTLCNNNIVQTMAIVVGHPKRRYQIVIGSIKSFQ